MKKMKGNNIIVDKNSLRFSQLKQIRGALRHAFGIFLLFLLLVSYGNAASMIGNGNIIVIIIVDF